MKRAEFLDRKYHYCRNCMKAFSIKEIEIIIAFFPEKGKDKLTIYARCPVCKRYLRPIKSKSEQCRKMFEEYLESEEYLSKKGGRK